VVLVLSRTYTPKAAERTSPARNRADGATFPGDGQQASVTTVCGSTFHLGRLPGSRACHRAVTLVSSLEGILPTDSDGPPQGGCAMRGEGVLGMFRIGLVVAGLAVPLMATATSPYRAPADLMADWLTREQSFDGSFGTQRTPECQQAAIRPLCTVEALAALDRLSRRNLSFRLGQAWLANNAVVGHELLARQVSVIGGVGGETARLASRLAQGQAAGAWGLAPAYQGSVWDTAAVTGSAAGLPGAALDLPAATTWLLNARLPTGGWSIGTSTDARLTPTALAVEALASRTSTDPAAAAALPDAITRLRSLMAGSTDLLGRARAVRALVASGEIATTELQALFALQNLTPSSVLYGSIAGDLRVTAVTAQAVGILLRAEIAEDETVVDVPDPTLRAAINEALGNGAMDRLTRADLARLTTLTVGSASAYPRSLSGLEYATNLAECQIRVHVEVYSALRTQMNALPCVFGVGSPLGRPIPEQVPLPPPPDPVVAPVQVSLITEPALFGLFILVASLGSLASRRAVGGLEQQLHTSAIALAALMTLTGLWPDTVQAAEVLTIEERQTLQHVSRAVLKGRALEAKRVREAVADEREALEPVLEDLRRLATAARPSILGSVAPTAGPDPIAVGSGEKVVSRATLTQPPNLPEPAQRLQPQGSSSPAGEVSLIGTPTSPPSPEPSAAGEPLAANAAAPVAGSKPSVAAPSGADNASLAGLDALRQRIATHRASRGGQLQPAPLTAGRAATAVAQPQGSPVPEGTATSAAVDASALDAVLAGVEESLARMSANEALDHGELQRLIGVLDESQAIDVADAPAPDPTLSTRTRHVDPVETQLN
jgi:hypothetical protein